MDAVIRGLVIYFFLLIIFRINGKRSIAQITVFDFVLLLVIGEATQQALLGNDFSVTNAILVITTLVLADLILSFIKQKSDKIAKWIEGMPLIIVENGKPIKDRLDKARVDEKDIMEAARKLHGLRKMNEIKFAILERDGDISIIPFSKSE